MVIECRGNTIKVWVNGDLVNHGYDCTASKGNIALQAEGAEAEGPATAVNEHVIAVRQLKVGTWVEFTGERESRVRAKLSWVSPISEKYLFVNQNGVKITEKSIYDLAAYITKARATILHQAPLFDRALDAIMKRLRSPTAAKAPPAAAAKPA